MTCCRLRYASYIEQTSSAQDCSATSPARWTNVFGDPLNVAWTRPAAAMAAAGPHR